MGIEHVPSVATTGILWTPSEDTDQVRTFTNLAKKRVRVKVSNFANETNKYGTFCPVQT